MEAASDDSKLLALRKAGVPLRGSTTKATPNLRSWPRSTPSYRCIVPSSDSETTVRTVQENHRTCQSRRPCPGQPRFPHAFLHLCPLKTWNPSGGWVGHCPMCSCTSIVSLPAAARELTLQASIKRFGPSGSMSRPQASWCASPRARSRPGECTRTPSRRLRSVPKSLMSEGFVGIIPLAPGASASVLWISHRRGFPAPLPLHRSSARRRV